MAIAREFNLKGVVVRGGAERYSRAILHALPRTPASMAAKNGRGNREGGSCHEIVGARLKTRKGRDANGGLTEPEPGNRQLPKGNPKTRSLLRVDILEPHPESPVIPVMSIVPLAAGSSVRMLLVHQSASEESV